MSLEPFNDSPRGADDDRPHLPSLPLEIICDRLQDTLGEALSIVALHRGISIEDLARKLSTNAEGTISEAEILLLFEGQSPITMCVIRRYAEALEAQPNDILRVALFCERQKERSEHEIQQDILWRTNRMLENEQD